MTTEEQVQESPLEMQPINIELDPFKEGGLSAEAPNVEVPKQEVKPPAEQEPAKVETPAVPVVDYNLYVKEKFGFDSEEVALSEIKRLKEQKVAEEKEFANEESKRAYEYLKEGKEDDLYNLLHEKKKIDRLLSIKPEEIKVDTASEIVKMEMQLKYPSLTPEQIQHRINRTYAIPPMPKQGLDETDEEYAEVLNEWRLSKEGVENDLIIDATIAMPSLEKRKTELKLPEIQKPVVDDGAAKYQEDLAKQQQIDADFKLKVPDTIKALSGVSVKTTVKYGDIDLPIEVHYAPSDVERAATQAATEDSMGFLAKEWFDEQGVPDPNKVASDTFLLKHKEAIFQKIATEAGTKAVKEYLNKRANVKLDDSKGGQPDFKAVNPDDEMARYFLRAS